PDKALAVSQSLLERQDADDATLFAGVDAALAAGDQQQAERWSRLGIDNGANPALLQTYAGRLAEARGLKAEALAHYREAEALSAQRRAALAGPPALARLDADGSQMQFSEPIAAIVGDEDVPLGPLLPRAPKVEPAFG